MGIKPRLETINQGNVPVGGVKKKRADILWVGRYLFWDVYLLLILFFANIFLLKYGPIKVINRFR